jgi:hypothetical protein
MKSLHCRTAIASLNFVMKRTLMLARDLRIVTCSEAGRWAPSPARKPRLTNYVVRPP